MKQSEMKNAPRLSGWVIAAAAGLVGGAVSYVVSDLGLMQVGLIGFAIFVVVGLFMGMPAGRQAPLSSSDVPASKALEVPAQGSAASVVHAPALAESASAAAAFVSAPIADAALADSVRTPKAKVAPVAKVAANPKAKVVAVPAATPAAAKPAVAKAPRVKKPDGPERLSAPRKGKADNLKEIEGIGPALEKLCHSLGFYHFDQIANWTNADVEWVDANMKAFKGRVVRDRWVAQSKIIITEGLEAFRLRAQTNDY